MLHCQHRLPNTVRIHKNRRFDVFSQANRDRKCWSDVVLQLASVTRIEFAARASQESTEADEKRSTAPSGTNELFWNDASSLAAPSRNVHDGLTSPAFSRCLGRARIAYNSNRHPVFLRSPATDDVWEYILRGVDLGFGDELIAASKALGLLVRCVDPRLHCQSPTHNHVSSSPSVSNDWLESWLGHRIRDAGSSQRLQAPRCCLYVPPPPLWTLLRTEL